MGVGLPLLVLAFCCGVRVVGFASVFECISPSFPSSYSPMTTMVRNMGLNMDLKAFKQSAIFERPKLFKSACLVLRKVPRSTDETVKFTLS